METVVAKRTPEGKKRLIIEMICMMIAIIICPMIDLLSIVSETPESPSGPPSPRFTPIMLFAVYGLRILLQSWRTRWVEISDEGLLFLAGRKRLVSWDDVKYMKTAYHRTPMLRGIRVRLENGRSFLFNRYPNQQEVTNALLRFGPPLRDDEMRVCDDGTLHAKRTRFDRGTILFEICFFWLMIGLCLAHEIVALFSFYTPPLNWRYRGLIILTILVVARLAIPGLINNWRTRRLEISRKGVWLRGRRDRFISWSEVRKQEEVFAHAPDAHGIRLALNDGTRITFNKYRNQQKVNEAFLRYGPKPAEAEESTEVTGR